MAEAGLSGYESVGWFGLVAPAGTPVEIIAKLNADVKTVVADADVREKLIGQGAVPQSTTPAELQKLIEAAPVVPCDVPAWEMFGISMAGYNFLYAMATGVIAAILSSRLFRSAR